MRAHTSPDASRTVESSPALLQATMRVPRAHPDDTVADIIRQLGQGGPYDSMTDVAVIETGRFLGLITIEQLFTASPNTQAAEIMDPNPPVVGAGADREEAQAKVASHPESSVGVVDIHGVFLGLIPMGRVSRTPSW